ncbi:MAG: hypothetical protein JWR59_141 [Brevundimonas sp.]|nr:hypothetical protein [Brevundimonas sp.]
MQSAVLKVLPLAGALFLASCGTATPTPSAGPVATELPSLAAAMDAEAASRGRAIAIIGCASCHAIDATGASALAAAPPFRDVVHRRSLDDLETAFATGLVTTHPAMPPYVFRASEIDDLIAYFDTLRTPQSLNGGRQG